MSNQPTVRTGCFQFTQKSYPIYTDKFRFSVPKRQLPLQADLIINRLRWESVVKRQHAVFDNYEDIPNRPQCDPLSKTQSRRLAAPADGRTSELHLDVPTIYETFFL
jgi:hypothetical protein